LKDKCLSGTLKCEHLNREREREREKEGGREREREGGRERERERAVKKGEKEPGQFIYFTYAHSILANLNSGEMSCIYYAIT